MCPYARNFDIESVHLLQTPMEMLAMLKVRILSKVRLMRRSLIFPATIIATWCRIDPKAPVALIGL